MILINVTGFFRHPRRGPTSRRVCSARRRPRREGSPIRVWSAGCAPARSRTRSPGSPVRGARRGGLPAAGQDLRHRPRRGGSRRGAAGGLHPKQLADVPEELRERYFSRSTTCFVFRNDAAAPSPLEERPAPGRAHLAGRPARLAETRSCTSRPPAGADPRQLLLLAEPEGFLVLGKAEALQSRTSLFVAHDLKRRVFVKNPDATPLRRRPPRDPKAEEAGPSAPLRDVAFEQAPRAELIVDLDGQVQAINHVARGMFGLRARDVGQPLSDLEVSYRPVELRSRDRPGPHGRRPITQDAPRPGRRLPGEQPLSERHRSPPLVHQGRRARPLAVSFRDVTRAPGAPLRSSSRPGASSSPPTRSCSRPSRSSRRRTRSSSPRTRSSRRPTRSCSRPTRSWRP